MAMHTDSGNDALQTKKNILKQLQTYNLEIPSTFQEVFDHHLDILIYRMENNECTNYQDDAVESQVDAEDLQIARNILLPLFEKYQIHENHMEEVLLAIYIKLAKGEKTNE